MDETHRPTSAPTVPERCARWAASARFQTFIIVVILANAALIGAETYPSVGEARAGLVDRLDGLFLGVFVVELIIRMVAYGRRPHRFFTGGWNIFDFVIVAIVFVPGLGSNLTLLRTVRVLRVIRLVAFLGDLRTIVKGLVRSLTSLAGVAVFVVMIVYVYAITGTALFGDDLPDEWGTAGTAMMTCFRILTLDNWDDSYFAALDVAGPITTAYFVSFIVVATLVILNIVIAVVVTSVEQAREAELADEAESMAGQMADQAPELADRINQLRMALDELERNMATTTDGTGDGPSPATAPTH